MNVDGAQRLIEVSIADDSYLLVAKHGIREDEMHYLVPVLNTRPMSEGDPASSPIASRLLLVDRESGQLERVTVPDAMTRAKTMRAVLPT